MVRKVHHDILKFEVPVDDKNCHHVVETSNQLPHDGLHDAWAQVVTFKIHNFLQVVTIAQLHEDIVPCISFDCLPHFNDILRKDGILILNFTHDQFLFGPAQS